MNTLIKLNNITHVISNKKIIDIENLDILEEGISFIKGPNGAGKTTLLKILARIISPTHGTVKYQNNYESAYVFQNPIFLNRSVIQNLRYVLEIKMQKYSSTFNTQIINILDEYHLVHLQNINANDLSGGEKQIISIIRAILTSPRILFLDEPTSNLDSTYKDMIQRIIVKYSINNKVVWITQGSQHINTSESQIIKLSRGKLVR
jgi:ABC-type multidrug transport system ATPase subunit